MFTVLSYFAANLGLRIGSAAFHQYGLKATAFAIGVAAVWFLTDRRRRQPSEKGAEAGGEPRRDDAATRFRRAAAAWNGERPVDAHASAQQHLLDDLRPKTADQLHKEADAALARALSSTNAADGAAWLRMASETRNAAERAQAGESALAASGGLRP